MVDVEDGSIEEIFVNAGFKPDQEMISYINEFEDIEDTNDLEGWAEAMFEFQKLGIPPKLMGNLYGVLAGESIGELPHVLEFVQSLIRIGMRFNVSGVGE
jgi:hypothetical protein